MEGGQIFRVTSSLTADDQERDYLVEGQFFFASADDFMAAFDFKEPLKLKIGSEYCPLANLMQILGIVLNFASVAGS